MPNMMLLLCLGAHVSSMGSMLTDIHKTFNSCRPYAEKYAEDQDAFFEDYVKSHLKLSELGVKWSPEPIEME